MQTSLENEVILEKTRQLCQTIVDQPAFQTIRGHIDAFLADPAARDQYQLVADKGEALHQKQHQGVPLTPEEIAEFEQQREVLASNPLARDFFSAQEQVQRVQEAVSRYVSRTLELGRVPGPDDLGSCGHGCGCHH